MDDDPHAEVWRVDRWTWCVAVIRGPYRYGPDGDGWYVHGSRNRAERKARKELARYRRQQQIRAEHFEVHDG